MKDLTQAELWHLRALIQRTGWGVFMRHVGSLMAEQADKVKPGSEQDTNLANCSMTIHAMDKFFEKCGHFDYTSCLGLVDEEYHKMLLENKP